MLTLIGNGGPLSEVSIKTLVGYMEHHHVPVRAIYLNSCLEISSRLMNEILALTKDSLLVGFSLMSKDVRIVLPLVKRIRNEQNKHIVWGGIHPTARPEESLQHCDFVCIGEGEEPLRQLYQSILHHSAYSAIPNIGYHAEGHLQINQVTYSPKSLDDLPFPDYKFSDSYCYQVFRPSIRGGRLARIPRDPMQRSAFFKTSSLMFYSQRGCKLACTYCSNSLYHHLAKTTCVKWYRYASVERIEDELRSHLRLLPFIKTIWLNDDDLLDRDIDQLRTIADFLKNELHLPFNINATPSHVTDEKIAVLARHGLGQVAMGVQSGSERILKHVFKRPIGNARVLETGRIIRKWYDSGVMANYGFILDNNFETDDDWRDSLRLMIALPRPRRITLYSLTYFPGTVLSEMALQQGYIKSIASSYDKMYDADIKPTYAYFLFILNTYLHLPDKLSAALLSDVMVKSGITRPLRFLLGQSTRSYKVLFKVVGWLLSVLPVSLEEGIMKGLRRCLYHVPEYSPDSPAGNKDVTMGMK